MKIARPAFRTIYSQVYRTLLPTSYPLPYCWGTCGPPEAGFQLPSLPHSQIFSMHAFPRIPMTYSLHCRGRQCPASQQIQSYPFLQPCRNIENFIWVGGYRFLKILDFTKHSLDSIQKLVIQLSLIPLVAK